MPCDHAVVGLNPAGLFSLFFLSLSSVHLKSFLEEVLFCLAVQIEVNQAECVHRIGKKLSRWMRNPTKTWDSFSYFHLTGRASAATYQISLANKEQPMLLKGTKTNKVTPTSNVLTRNNFEAIACWAWSRFSVNWRFSQIRWFACVSQCRTICNRQAS